VHKDGDQFFRIEEGSGVVTIGDRETEIADGDGIVIAAGACHIENAGDYETRCALWPSHHRDGYSASTKAKAEQRKRKFDDREVIGRRLVMGATCRHAARDELS
jgi:uncharacterized cupin superfamily protein